MTRAGRYVVMQGAQVNVTNTAQTHANGGGGGGATGMFQVYTPMGVTLLVAPAGTSPVFESV